MLFRHYIAEILPILLKTLSKQSINSMLLLLGAIITAYTIK